jgi:adenylate cyclase
MSELTVDDAPGTAKQEGPRSADAPTKKKGRSFWRRFIHWWGGGRFISLVILFVLGLVQASEFTPGEDILNRTREATLLPLRNALFDFYQTQVPRAIPEGHARPVVIVDIDEPSLAEVGQWPWPRDDLAKMVAFLMKSGALAIGFDVVFAEQDRLSPNLVAQRAASRNLSPEALNELRALPSNDAVFADALQQSRVVLGQVANNLENVARKLPKGPPMARRGERPEAFIQHGFRNAIRNFEVLESATPGLGMINVEPDPDGIVRRAPALLRVAVERENGKIRQKIYPSLVVEMYRVATGDPRRPFYVSSNALGINEVALTKDFSIPTTRDGDIWVYYAKPGETTGDLYVSAKDVLNETLPAERFQNKFVLVGTSAAGLRDIRVTPITNNMPGVEVHANMIETIWFRTPLVRPNNALDAELLGVIIGGLLLIAFLPMIGAVWSLVLAGAVVAGFAAFSWFSFAGLEWWFLQLPGRALVDFSFFAVTIILLYSVLTFSSYSRTAAERRQVRGAFSQYLSPALVEQLADDPDRLQLGGEMRSMTFLFCDIRGFTAISETFKTDPQGLTKLINKFLTPMTDIIMERQGTIDKYMGDCIMAFWNAPLDDPAHYRHACESALAMFEFLPKLNNQIEEEAKAENRQFHPIRIGIGINTGECVVGNMGSEKRFDYSVLGDAVNLASRLEGQSKNYGVNIVIGEETQADVPDFATIELDLIAVKGKEEAVRIYALLGDATMKADPAYQALIEKHDNMLKIYRSQKWDDAEAMLPECNEAAHKAGVDLSVLYELYSERMALYKWDPPPKEWDGVFVATSK